MKKIRVFSSPEAKKQGKDYEDFPIIDESQAGVLVRLGYNHWELLPWEYLSKLTYRYISN